MGKIVSRVKRPFQNFNVEDRAHKIISQDKPTPAPKYKVEEMEIQQLMREKPQEFEKTLQKDKQLDENLKSVFVTSNKISPDENTEFPKRPLPLSRQSLLEPMFGVVEPEKIPDGKISLTNALKFITNHQADPIQCSVTSIAKSYNLPEETVRNILRYCKPFEIYMPQDRKTKVNFAGPSIKRLKVLARPIKQIEENSKTQENT